ncbi:COBRA-like protein [Tanacetum coccineum]
MTVSFTPPHYCKKAPSIIDLLPGTPYNQQIANCCKGGVINSWAQEPNNYASSFQLSVGAAETTNKTVKPPKNFTLLAPGPGYTCGPTVVGKPSKFVTPDGRQVTQAMKLLFGATYYGNGVYLWIAGCILAELLAGKSIMPGRTEVEL